MNPVSTAPKYPYGELWDTCWIRSDNLPGHCPENLLHFRVSRDGRVIGQGNNQTQYAWYWDGGSWQNLGPTVGTNVAAFGPDGTVYVSTKEGVMVTSKNGGFVRLIPGYVGANGIRFVRPDGSVATGDATYAGPLGIHQFTDVGDGILVGQGPERGAVVHIDGKLRWLYNGPFVQFVRVNRVGDTVYVHLAQEQGLLAVPVVKTIAELKALPEVVAAPPPVVNKPPVTQPEHPPVADKELDKHVLESLKAAVARARARYGTPLGAKHKIFLADMVLEMRAAQPDLKIGLFRKDGGEHVTMPSNINVSQDIVSIHRGSELWQYDALGSGETSATPMFRRTGDPNSGNPAADGIEPDVKKFYDLQKVDIDAVHAAQQPPVEDKPPVVEPPHVDPPSPPVDEPPTVPDIPVTPLPHGDELSAILAAIHASDASAAERAAAAAVVAQQQLDEIKGLHRDLQALGEEAKKYLPGLIGLLANGGASSGLGGLLGGLIKK